MFDIRIWRRKSSTRGEWESDEWLVVSMLSMVVWSCECLLGMVVVIVELYEHI